MCWLYLQYTNSHDVNVIYTSLYGTLPSLTRRMYNCTCMIVKISGIAVLFQLHFLEYNNSYSQTVLGSLIYKVLVRLQDCDKNFLRKFLPTLQQKSHLCFSRKGIVQPQSQYPQTHECGNGDCNSFSGNICFEFSVLCLFNISHR